MHQSLKNQVVLTFHGGAIPNPGKGACGYTITTPDGQIIEHGWTMPGITTNNEAEYEALEEGLKRVISEFPTLKSLVVMGDSQLVIKQVTCEWTVRNTRLKEYQKRIVALTRGKLRVHYTHIPRELNGEADLLTRTAR